MNLDRHIPTASPRWATVALSALLLVVTGCNEQGVVHPSPVLDWKRVDVSPRVANLGDTILVEWDYANSSKLKKQKLQLIRLSLAGLVSEAQDLPRTQRSATFSFDGPVTVVITATDKKDKQIDAAFDVKLDSVYHFTITGVQETHPGFPRLGQRNVGTVTVNGRTSPSIDRGPFDIDFTHFFGIYEVPDLDANGQPTIEDGRIDDIPSALRQALPGSQDFFGHSFNVRADFNPPFNFRLGSSFPILDPGFLLTDEGSQFVGVRTRCDAVAFAGKVAYDGTEVRDRKTGLRYRKNVTQFEPIFATIDLRTDDAGTLHVADIDVGNAHQGLVLSAYHGATEFRFVGTGQPTYAGVEFYGDTGDLSGNLKSSRIGFGVTTSSNQVLTTSFGGIEVPGVYADVDAIDWHIPFLPDTDLSGLN